MDRNNSHKVFYVRTKNRVENGKVFRGDPILCVAFRYDGPSVEFGYSVPNPKMPFERGRLRNIALTRLNSGKTSTRAGSGGGTHHLLLVTSTPTSDEVMEAIRHALLNQGKLVPKRVVRQLQLRNSEISDTDRPQPYVDPFSFSTEKQCYAKTLPGCTFGPKSTEVSGNSFGKVRTG